MNARQLRAKRNPWTAEDIAFLKKHYAAMDTAELAERLGRSAQCVRATARNHGLKKPDQRIRWTEDKLAWLEENYSRLKPCELAEHFGCSVRQVQRTVNRYGIKKSRAQNADAEMPKETKRSNAYGDPKRIGKNKNPVTSATKTLVSVCILDHIQTKDIAAMTARSIEQVEEIAELVKASGYLAWIESRRRRR